MVLGVADVSSIQHRQQICELRSTGMRATKPKRVAAEAFQGFIWFDLQSHELLCPLKFCFRSAQELPMALPEERGEHQTPPGWDK